MLFRISIAAKEGSMHSLDVVSSRGVFMVYSNGVLEGGMGVGVGDGADVARPGASESTMVCGLVVSLALCRSARGAKGRARVLACALKGVEEVRLRLPPYVFICTKIFLRE